MSFEKSVIGEDTRVRANSHKAYVGHVGAYCTGTLIADDIVITAAHCVYSQKYQEHLKSPYFRPSRKGDLTPFGTFNWKSIYLYKAYAKDSDKASDVAFIKLNRRVKGIKYYPRLKQGRTNDRVSITGYPKDRQFGTAWTSKCKAKKSGKFYEHKCDTAGGMSGSALIRNNNLVGIHALGNDDFNRAIRVDGQIISAFHRIKSSKKLDSSKWLTFRNDSKELGEEFDRVILENSNPFPVTVEYLYYDLNRNEVLDTQYLEAKEKKELFKTRRSKFYLRYSYGDKSFPKQYEGCQLIDESCAKKIVLKGANWKHQLISLPL